MNLSGGVFDCGVGSDKWCGAPPRPACADEPPGITAGRHNRLVMSWVTGKPAVLSGEKPGKFRSDKPEGNAVSNRPFSGDQNAGDSGPKTGVKQDKKRLTKSLKFSKLRHLYGC